MQQQCVYPLNLICSNSIWITESICIKDKKEDYLLPCLYQEKKDYPLPHPSFLKIIYRLLSSHFNQHTTKLSFRKLTPTRKKRYHPKHHRSTRLPSSSLAREPTTVSCPFTALWSGSPLLLLQTMWRHQQVVSSLEVAAITEAKTKKLALKEEITYITHTYTHSHITETICIFFV